MNVKPFKVIFMRTLLGVGWHLMRTVPKRVRLKKGTGRIYKLTRACASRTVALFFIY